MENSTISSSDDRTTITLLEIDMSTKDFLDNRASCTGNSSATEAARTSEVVSRMA